MRSSWQRATAVFAFTTAVVAPRVEASPRARPGIAVLTAVQDYRKGFTPLPSAVNDLGAMIHALRTLGFHGDDIHVLTNVDKRRLLDNASVRALPFQADTDGHFTYESFGESSMQSASRFLELVRQKSEQAELLEMSHFIVYFSGHGAVFQQQSDGPDVPAVAFDETDNHPKTWVQIGEITDAVNARFTSKVNNTIIIDACEVREPTDYGLLADNRSGYIDYLFSSSPGQPSYVGPLAIQPTNTALISVFTAHLSLALNGKRLKDGKVEAWTERHDRQKVTDVDLRITLQRNVEKDALAIASSLAANQRSPNQDRRHNRSVEFDDRRQIPRVISDGLTYELPP